MIASYALAQLEKDSVEIRLYTEPEKLLDDLDSWKPSVLGLTNYMWNSELSRLTFEYGKEKNADIICVSGGPNFPRDLTECHVFLSKRKDIDFNISFEGEVAFLRLMEALKNSQGSLDDLKNQAHPNVMSIHSETGELVSGPILPRLTSLDEIPSPYLTGLLTPWFDGNYAPMVETARGCPYQCTFCLVGIPEYTKLAVSRIERVKAELIYIAERMQNIEGKLVCICDSNFGMYERDEEIAAHLRMLQEKYNWPLIFEVSTGKSRHERILRVASTLQNKMFVTGSVQTLNAETAKLIKRKNLPLPKYLDLIKEIKERRMRAAVEMIFPLPGETKESFLRGIEIILDIGAGVVVPYTTMLLPGTELASKENRKKHGMISRYRVLPRNFAEFRGKKSIEWEEVCVATNTMSYADYLDCRGFSFVSALYASEQYDVICRHLKHLGITPFTYYSYLWGMTQNDQEGVGSAYKNYMNETEAELWDSPEDIYDYFSESQNYEKLSQGVLGDNLIRKYVTKVYLDHGRTSFDLAYHAIEMLLDGKLSAEYHGFMEATKQWVMTTRDIASLLNDDANLETERIMELPYDINSWYLTGEESKDKLVTDFYKPTQYSVSIDASKIRSIFKEARRLYGEDLKFCFGKLMVNTRVKDFWRQCLPVDMAGEVDL